MQQTQQQSYSTSAAGISAGLAGVMDCCGGGGEVRLFDVDSHAKPFQKGATDSFTVLCHNVGLPQSAQEGLQGLGVLSVQQVGAGLAVCWNVAGVLLRYGFSANVQVYCCCSMHSKRK